MYQDVLILVIPVGKLECFVLLHAPSALTLGDLFITYVMSSGTCQGLCDTWMFCRCVQLKAGWMSAASASTHVSFILLFYQKMHFVVEDNS